MINDRSKSAIFIFRRSQRVEARKKKLTARGLQSNESIIRQLNRHSIELVESTGMDLFEVNGDISSPSMFGSALASAFQSIFDKGYEKVIAIGNDCPELDRETLIHAADSISRERTVIGPAKDGGIYLFGLHHQMMDATLFDQLPWCTSKLFDALTILFLPQQLLLLSKKSDLDTVTDLRRYLSSHGTSRLKSVIRQLISKATQVLLNNQRLIQRIIYFFHSPRRGPPVLYCC